MSERRHRAISGPWAWLALGAVVVATLTWVAWPRGSESIDAHVTRLAAELRCLECEGLSVADASTSTARATRADIRQRVEDGQRDEEIRQAYVDLYGERVLLVPTSSGVSALVWALPVTALIVAGAGVGVVAWRSRRARRLTASAADEELVARVVASGDVADLGGGGSRGPYDEERDFLLRSIADLDTEHVTGELDAETYTILHADYTARVATLLREREQDPPKPAAPRSDEPSSTPWARRLLVGGGVVVFACIAGGLLAVALGARLPGELSSGNESVSTEEREGRLRQAVADNPDDPGAHLALANWLVQNDDLAGALEEYDTAAALDATDPEAPAQAGWILFLTASGTPDEQQQTALLEGARERLDRAVTVDPDYADARFYRGMLRFRGDGDAAGAVPEFQRYLVLAPESPLAEQVRQLLEEAIAASGSTVPDTPG